MSLSRRGFLGALIASATLDPERLLYVPGAKLISIPAPKIFTCADLDSTMRRIRLNSEYGKFGHITLSIIGIAMTAVILSKNGMSLKDGVAEDHIRDCIDEIYSDPKWGADSVVKRSA